MPSITVTINTPASGPFQLSRLLAGDTYAGAVTIAPVTPLKAPRFPGYLSVQSDPANTTNFVIIGDSTITQTTGGKRLAQSVVDARWGPDTPPTSLVYIQGSAATVIANIEVWGGKQ